MSFMPNYKSVFFLLLMIAAFGVHSYTQPLCNSTYGTYVKLKCQTSRGHHAEFSSPADQPDIFYLPNTKEIKIIGFDSSLVSYDIEITDAEGTTCVVTSVAGFGTSIIELPEMADGVATIAVIALPIGNQYTGTFYYSEN